MSLSEDEFSDTDFDYEFNKDMEVLKKAWQLIGEKPIDHQLPIVGATANSTDSLGTESDEEGDGDLELVQSIQERFAIVPMDTKVEPLRTLPPDWSDDDDCEDDYATLQAIQRRFAAYNDGGLGDIALGSNRPVEVGSIIIDLEKETSNSFVQRTNTRERFVNRVDTSGAIEKETSNSFECGGVQHVINECANIIQQKKLPMRYVMIDDECVLYEDDTSNQVKTEQETDKNNQDYKTYA